MNLYGIGFKDLVHCGSTKEKENKYSLYMKLLSKSLANTFGYGFVLNQLTNLCLDPHF